MFYKVKFIYIYTYYYVYYKIYLIFIDSEKEKRARYVVLPCFTGNLFNRILFYGPLCIDLYQKYNKRHSDIYIYTYICICQNSKVRKNKDNLCLYQYSIFANL